MHRNQLLLAGFRVGMSLRIGLALFSTLASVGLAFVLITGSHHSAHAAPAISEISASVGSADPWGLAFDSRGNEWVAEPGCDPNPVCGTTTVGNIAQVDRASFKVVHNFAEPKNFSSPVFVAVDASGNIWFSEPMTNNAIGELIPNFANPSGSTWNQWTVPTAKAAPFDLAFDAQGNLWFTEILANKIGEFTPSTQQFAETATPSAASKPYGIVGPDPGTGAMWFTENNSAVAHIGSFIPPTSGALSTASIKEYLTKAGGGATPHLITFDGRGNIWWTEGPNGYIGSLNISQASTGTSNGVTEYHVPAASCKGCGTHISGIGIDSTGTVWFDDSLGQRVVSYVPSSNSFSQYTVGPNVNAHPHDGLAVDGTNAIFFNEEFANLLGKATQSGIPPPTVTPPGSPTATPSPTPVPGPIARTWYFAEGRVGSGFREYLTIGNPTTNACTANIKYLYTMDGSTTSSSKTVTVPVPAATRATQSVNTDLGIFNTMTPAATLSAIVTVDASTPTCTGFVVERPVYFSSYHGLSSGTDVLGSTTLGKTFNFADVPSGSGYNSYLTILNPGNVTANVVVKYFAGGKMVGTQTQTVAATSRGTIAPGAIPLPTHSAAVVTSDQPVIVERPTYINNVNGYSGAADVIGSQVLASDWLFAEGYAAANSQEFLTIANVDPAASATVTITLKSRTGATRTLNVTVPVQSQLVWSVNANDTFNGSSPEVSAEVASTGANILVQREMFYQYHHTLSNGMLQTNSVTDVMGMVASTARSAYSFAEGYTNTNYHEWLTLQNSTASTETIYVTLVNGRGKSFTQSISVVANSRSTVDITLLVQQNLAQPGDIPGNEISMTVQTLNRGAIFVVERPIYFNTTGSAFVVQGGSDIIGYGG